MGRGRELMKADNLSESALVRACPRPISFSENTIHALIEYN